MNCWLPRKKKKNPPAFFLFYFYFFKFVCLEHPGVRGCGHLHLIRIRPGADSTVICLIKAL